MHVDRSPARESWSIAVPRLRWRTPVFSPRDEVVVAGFTLWWTAALANFVLWWLQPAHVTSVVRLLVTSLVLAGSLALPMWLLGAVRRMRRPAPELTVPDLRVAMVVTKSPGEPWAIVEETIEGMLIQDTRHPYDVWLADEAPTVETRRWCAERGVRISSRQGVEAYHREEWPRRARTKEGNLAYFYDTVGYERYDVVAQFDADHVPESTYLSALLPAFADPAIGYVATPSICDSNAHHSWAARGRLHREATLHGPLQAGHNDGMAPTAIGSHYAVRTAALKDCGGLGPELAEDFSTSFIMNVRGWRGSFAIDAIAHGEGPETFADAMVQEFQWARSLQTLSLRQCRHLWIDLPARARWKLRFALWWYAVFALQMFVGYLMPIVAVLTATPWVKVNLLEFLSHTGLLTMSMICLAAWLRSRGLLRPIDAPILSWESVVFQLTRWPWVLFGIAQAYAGWMSDREFSFKVTPKGEETARGLPIVTVVPYVALSMFASGVMLIAPDPGAARGYLVLVAVAALIYAIVAWLIPFRHRRENRGLRLRSLVPHAALASVTTLVLAAAIAHQNRQGNLGADGALAALDPTALAAQPTSWLWVASFILTAVYLRRHRPPKPDASVPAASAATAEHHRTGEGTSTPSVGSHADAAAFVALALTARSPKSKIDTDELVAAMQRHGVAGRWAPVDLVQRGLLGVDLTSPRWAFFVTPAGSAELARLASQLGRAGQEQLT